MVFRESQEYLMKWLRHFQLVEEMIKWCWISGWHHVTSQWLQCKSARRKTNYFWYDHCNLCFSGRFSKLGKI